MTTWKEKGKGKICPSARVRRFNSQLTANIPRSVLEHLGATPEAQIVFKLRKGKGASIKILKLRKERVLTFKASKRRKEFPTLSAFINQ